MGRLGRLTGCVCLMPRHAACLLFPGGQRRLQRKKTQENVEGGTGNVVEPKLERSSRYSRRPNPNHKSSGLASALQDETNVDQMWTEFRLHTHIHQNRSFSAKAP